jgi:hypothetical protein
MLVQEVISFVKHICLYNNSEIHFHSIISEIASLKFDTLCQIVGLALHSFFFDVYFYILSVWFFVLLNSS